MSTKKCLLFRQKKIGRKREEAPTGCFFLVQKGEETQRE
jgi:hypothetical protein